MRLRYLLCVPTLLVAGAVLTSAQEPGATAGWAHDWFDRGEVFGPKDIRFQVAPDRQARGRRCGVPHGNAALRALVSESLDFARALAPAESRRRRTIPLAFHVVHANGRGDVEDAAIEEQVAVINAAFRNSRLRFELASIDRTDRPAWHRRCYGFKRNGDYRPKFERMTQSLAIDPATTLNIYLCNPDGGTLGFAMYPWWFFEEDPLYSVVVDYRTLPGGSAAPYDLGLTAVHEVGHAFGLYHTFEGGCLGPGDEIADTPFEAEPAYGCPVGRDSCLADPGEDPITNFMDYSDDSCLDRFTRRQRREMREVLSLYRPSLGTSETTD